MKLFRCFILGENFPGKILSQSTPIGFYTTRFVRAVNSEEAEMAALTLLRDDEALRLDPSDRPPDAKLFFESVEEIDELPEGCREPGGGFTFFDMGT